MKHITFMGQLDPNCKIEVAEVSDEQTGESELTTSDFDGCQEGGDAGIMLVFRCPECGGEVRWAAGAWWKVRCQCPREWRVVAFSGEKGRQK